MSCYKLIFTINIAVSQKVKVSFEEELNIKIKNTIACKMAVEVFYNSQKRLNLHNFTEVVS